MGETYATAVSGAAKPENDFKFHGVEAEYEMASLFETSHAKSVFGKAHSGGKARKLIEVGVSFSLLKEGYVCRLLLLHPSTCHSTRPDSAPALCHVNAPGCCCATRQQCIPQHLMWHPAFCQLKSCSPPIRGRGPELPCSLL